MAKETRAAQALKPPTLTDLQNEIVTFRSEINNKVEELKVSFGKEHGKTREQIKAGFAVVAECFDKMDKRTTRHERLLIGLLDVLSYKDVLSSEELAKLVISDEAEDDD